MKIKRIQLVVFNNILNQLSNKEASVKFSYAILKNKKAIKDDIESMAEVEKNQGEDKKEFVKFLEEETDFDSSKISKISFNDLPNEISAVQIEVLEDFMIEEKPQNQQ